MAPKRLTEDEWNDIEKRYRVGQATMRSLADEYGINVSTISRRAKKEKWVIDKTNEVRERTRAALIVSEGGNVDNTTLRDEINIAVASNLEVIRSHRKTVKNGIELVKLLASQLQDVANHRETIESLINEDTKGHDGAATQVRRRTAMMKAVALPTNSGVLRDLSMALSKLIPLERQAFNIDTEPQETLERIIANNIKPEKQKALNTAYNQALKETQD